MTVARALLTDRGPNGERKKLLLVAYTNHALDQILEAIIVAGFDSELVLRLGSRCTAPAIEQLTLNDRVKRLQGDRMRPDLSPQDRRRNAELQEQMSSLRKCMREGADALAGVVWDVPELVPLSAVQAAIEVLFYRPAAHYA